MDNVITEFNKAYEKEDIKDMENVLKQALKRYSIDIESKAYVDGFEFILLPALNSDKNKVIIELLVDLLHNKTYNREGMNVWVRPYKAPRNF